MMMTLQKQLQDFKLAGMASSIEERISFAQSQQLGYLEFLELLCEDETCSRNQNGYKKRLSKAKLPALKTIEDFNFSFQPSIDKRKINDICTCQFIENNANVIFI